MYALYAYKPDGECKTVKDGDYAVVLAEMCGRTAQALLAEGFTEWEFKCITSRSNP